MKKLLFLLIAANGMLSASAQTKDTASKHKEYAKDAQMPGWAVDVNLLGGVLTRDMTTGNSMGNYLNALSDANLGNLKFTNGTSFGADLQLGYFFGASHHFGVGLGFMYLAQSGDATLDNFHVQYQSTDNLNEISRQIITANGPVKESLKITNMNIPLVLKYKVRFSKRFGFTTDLGILYNVTMKNSYKTNASFDYEEIVKHVTTADGSTITVYDNSLTPNPTDLLVTKAFFNTISHADGQTIGQYFTQQQGYGYNVGLAVAPAKKSGDVSYTSGSVGFLFRPALNYFFSDNVALTVGGYFMYQPFNNNTTNNYRLTDKTGDYSSVLNNVSKSNDMSYGGNLGIRFLFGKKGEKKPENISVEGTDPTACGLADGAITIHGLTAGKLVNINYTVDGKPNMAPGMTADATGNVKIGKLPAGSYSNIVVTMGKHHMEGNQVTLVNPALNVYTSSTNPTAADACDGTLSVGGLKAGQKVTINYTVNGAPKSPYIGIVGSNNAVTLTSLCAGTYSRITVTAGECKGNGSDVTLTYVAPAAPTQPAENKAALADITAPILFEFGKTSILPSSYPVLEQAVLEVGRNSNFYIICEGHTDNTGSVERNEVLSFKRANSVKQYLIKLGVDREKIIAVGRGSRMPIAPNDTPEGRAKNRRVVMTLNERSK